MKQRNILAVVLLPFITLGIYTIYWFVSTKGELNKKGASIPTAWLIIIPFVSYWWVWKYFEAAEQVTDKKVNGVVMFIVAFFITSIISSAICQNEYNKLSELSLAQDPVASTNSSSTSEVSSASATPVVASSPMSQDITTGTVPNSQATDDNSTTT